MFKQDVSGPIALLTNVAAIIFIFALGWVLIGALCKMSALLFLVGWDLI